MAGLHGKNGKIVVDNDDLIGDLDDNMLLGDGVLGDYIGQAGANYEVLEVTDWSVEITSDTIEDTAMSPTAAGKTFLTTPLEWSGTMTCNRDRATGHGQDLLTAGAFLTLKLYPEGEAGGGSPVRPYYMGNARVTKYAEAASLNGKIGASIAVKGDNVLLEVA